MPASWSWAALAPRAGLTDAWALDLGSDDLLVAIETEPGDATVHFGCGLHAGPAPTGSASRRTLYLQHYKPETFDLIGPYQGYNQIIPGYGEGDIPNIEEVQARQADG